MYVKRLCDTYINQGDEPNEVRSDDQCGEGENTEGRRGSLLERALESSNNWHRELTNDIRRSRPEEGEEHRPKLNEQPGFAVRKKMRKAMHFYDWLIDMVM